MCSCLPQRCTCVKGKVRFEEGIPKSLGSDFWLTLRSGSKFQILISDLLTESCPGTENSKHYWAKHRPDSKVMQEGGIGRFNSSFVSSREMLHHVIASILLMPNLWFKQGNDIFFVGAFRSLVGWYVTEEGKAYPCNFLLIIVHETRHALVVGTAYCCTLSTLHNFFANRGFLAS